MPVSAAQSADHSPSLPPVPKSDLRIVQGARRDSHLAREVAPGGPSQVPGNRGKVQPILRPGGGATLRFVHRGPAMQQARRKISRAARAARYSPAGPPAVGDWLPSQASWLLAFALPSIPACGLPRRLKNAVRIGERSGAADSRRPRILPRPCGRAMRPRTAFVFPWRIA